MKCILIIIQYYLPSILAVMSIVPGIIMAITRYIMAVSRYVRLICTVRVSQTIEVITVSESEERERADNGGENIQETEIVCK